MLPPHTAPAPAQTKTTPTPSPPPTPSAPEIDVLEAEHNKLNTQAGEVVSQSAPFTHVVLYDNATTDQFEILDETISWPNRYKYVLIFFRGRGRGKVLISGQRLGDSACGFRAYAYAVEYVPRLGAAVR